MFANGVNHACDTIEGVLSMSAPVEDGVIHCRCCGRAIVRSVGADVGDVWLAVHGADRVACPKSATKRHQPKPKETRDHDDEPPVLHLYALQRNPGTDPADYGEFKGAIVAAYSDHAARRIHPAGGDLTWGTYYTNTPEGPLAEREGWCNGSEGAYNEEADGAWVNPAEVDAPVIGIAADPTLVEGDVLCADLYTAGSQP